MEKIKGDQVYNGYIQQTYPGYKEITVAGHILNSLEKLEEAIKYSDPVSNNQTLEIEKEIINDLKNIKTNDSIFLLNKKVEKRNKICKESK